MNINLRNKETQKKIAIASALILIPALWWGGYSERMETVTGCRATAEYYVTAEYSETETYPVTSTDANGVVSTTLETSTDYWSLPASERWRVETINGEVSIIVGEMEGMTNLGYGVPKMPPHDIRMSRDYNFDNFEYHRAENLIVTTREEISKETGYFSDPIRNNLRCIDKLNRTIIVKTWYGISYGSDF